MDEYTRNLFGDTCPYTALPCKYRDLDCKDCGVEIEECKDLKNKIKGELE